MKKKVCGVGITDVKIVDEDGIVLKSYKAWTSLVRRCYDKKLHERQPTYVNCTVEDNWLTYSNFKKWFDINYIDGHELDKDLLQSGIENKIYSESTCLFLPSALNGFMTNQQSDNTSGFVGVCYHRRYNKWMTQIRVYNHTTKTTKRKHLGYFNDIEEGARAYKKERAIQASVWKSVMIEQYGWSKELADNIK